MLVAIHPLDATMSKDIVSQLYKISKSEEKS